MDEKITIELSKKQRDLLLKYESSFDDHELFRLISIAVNKGKNYEIYLTEEQLDGLTNEIFTISENEENKKLADQLNDLWEYLEDLCDEHGIGIGDDDDIDYSEHSHNTGAVCILKVALAGEDKIWRKIAIRGGQTLHCLHDIIFDAFDREEDHMYSFFFPHSLKKADVRHIYDSSDEYTHPYVCQDRSIFGSGGKDGSKATIESLNLREGQVFYYLFDFGDEWWHEITVEKTGGTADEKKYPRITERKGKSPDQYEDDDEDD